ncbi:MAG: hypothetical protein QXX12_01650 [Nanopusillaceae archaeon]
MDEYDEVRRLLDAAFQEGHGITGTVRAVALALAAHRVARQCGGSRRLAEEIALAVLQRELWGRDYDDEDVGAP